MICYVALSGRHGNCWYTKILPSFIEEIIKKNKAVKEVVVFSVKDTLHNDDMPCAAVVRTDEKALTEHSLKPFVKKEL